MGDVWVRQRRDDAINEGDTPQSPKIRWDESVGVEVFDDDIDRRKRR